MLRYLTAAFWAAPDIPGIGPLPANAIAVAGLTILGIGHPGFWLLGLGLETAYLFGLTSSARFRRLVDAQALDRTDVFGADQRRTLVAKLDLQAQQRMLRLEAKTAQILELYRDSQTEVFVVEANREALRKLAWLYLKLLVAQSNIAAIDSARSQDEVARKIAELQKDLRSGTISSALVQSKQATLVILEQRRASMERSAQTMEEIDSDLTRIEAQIDLALDNAGMRGKSAAISGNIDLVSRLLDDSIYGDWGSSVPELERTHGKEME